MTTINAIESRVRRRLRNVGERLCKPRSEGMRLEYGEYHIVDIRTNCICASHIDLIELAKELNAISPGEIRQLSSDNSTL